MDLTLTPQEQAFRDELRQWLADNMPGDEPDGDDHAAFEFRKQWQHTLADARYAGLSWPEEYGGRGATLIEQAIFNEEIVRAKAPPMANVLGLVMGGPVVIAHGTPEQKQRYLRPILTAEEIWCQGFSEPESGSDLASLKTKAVKDGDEWVVTGQKVWTTYAHEAKWCMLVARTDFDVPKHKGLTYFLMDMEQDAVQLGPTATAASPTQRTTIKQVQTKHHKDTEGKQQHARKTEGERKKEKERKKERKERKERRERKEKRRKKERKKERKKKKKKFFFFFFFFAGLCRFGFILPPPPPPPPPPRHPPPPPQK